MASDAFTPGEDDTPLEGLGEAFEDEARGLEGRLVADHVRQRLFGQTPRAVNVGRFRLGPIVGRGAMGVVHEAHDDNLERKVAIKFIEASRAQAPVAKQRMLREARAMAKLSHPNVVSIFEEGEFEGRVYIAMEFVEGSTVREWLREPRSASEVLDCFLAAGRGLAAAHRAGMVHRDFKPENVLVGADGVPKVADFGLAGVDVAAESRGPLERDGDSEPLTPAAGQPERERLTEAGARLGTALYMAPEQHRGERATAASDQFAFCVSLFEAQAGTHPFHDNDLEATLDAMERGELQSKTRQRLSPSMRRVLQRGLRPDPAQRYASMDELLLALERTRRSGRGWRIASAAVLVAGAAWVVANPGPEPCKDVAASLHNVWNDDARTRIEQAVSGTGNTSAAARIQSLVDVYAGQWSEMRVESCMATHRGEQSPQVLDRRMRCLDERLTELRTSLEVVTQTASQEQQQGLIDIIAGLPMLDGCANVAWLETAQPGDPPAEFAEDSQTLWEGVATMEAQLRGGQQRDAKVLARELVATAERISDARARAKVLALVGSIEAGDEVFETARAKLHDAFYTAGAVGLDDLCVTIACDIANFEAYEDPKQAEQWHRHANTALQRGRLAGSSTEAYFEHSVGIRRSVAGDRAEAVEHFERALSLWKAVGAEDHAEASATHRSLGLALSALQRRDEARHHLDRAYELRSQTFGEAHTATISSRIALGQLDHDEGRYEEAIVQLEAALRSAEQALGRNHVKVADICNNISSPLLVLQRTAPAIAYLERAQGIYAALPAHKDDLAMVAFNLGNLFGAEQRFEDAKASYERAATSWEEVWGASDSRTLRARIGSALVLADLGEPRLAQQRVETIIPLFEMKRDGPGLLAEMQGVLADLSFRAGDVTRARAAIEEGRRLAALDPEGTKAILEYFDELLREHAP